MQTFDERLHSDGTADTDALVQSLLESINDAQPWAQRAALAEDTLNCVWAGQTDDGRKREREGFPPPFPWDGASDTRIRLAAQKCREIYSLCNQAYLRGNWKFVGVDGFDFIKADKMTQFLKWQTQSQMGHSERQRKIATKWALTYGLSVLSVSWERTERIGLEAISPKTLADSLGIGDFWEEFLLSPDDYLSQMDNGELTGSIDPETAAKIRTANMLHQWLFAEEDVYAVGLEQHIRSVYPDCDAKTAKAVAAALRKGEEASVPRKRRVYDAPKWEAFLPFYNIFFPVDTTDIQRARWIAIRKWYSRTEVERQKWPQEFKDELLKHEGVSSTEGLEGVRRSSRRWRAGFGGVNSPFLNRTDRKGQYEVFEFYYPATNKNGVELIKRTVLSQFAAHKDGGEKAKYIVAEDGIFDEAGGYPFVAFEFYCESDFLLENQGIPLLVYTHQAEVKAQRDSRIDLENISLLPPVLRNVRDSKRPLVVGPAQTVFESTPGSTQWMRAPNAPTADSVQLENAVLRDVNLLLGSPDKTIPDAVSQVIQNEICDSYLESMQEVLSKTYRLDQIYMDEAVVLRVNGVFTEPFKVSRDEIQGEYDIILRFDPREMNRDYMKQKADLLRGVLEMDINGTIDRNRAVQLFLRMVDSDWAEALITSDNQASQKEITEEKNNVAMMMSGQEPVMKEQENAQMRLEYLQNVVAASPVIQAAIAQNETVRALFDNRVKHLQFLQQQEQNKIIGRMGVKPVLEGAQ